MSDSVLSLGAALVAGWWSTFDIPVPGFGFTFKQMYLGIAVCMISVIAFRVILGLGNGSTSYRSGTSRKPKISKERSKDEK